MGKLNTNYDFIQGEKDILNYWNKEDVFNKIKQKNINGPKYRFIDGPITANNTMKIHHVWGRTIKDSFMRYKLMNGYTSHFRNGFDSQGLWVEVEVEKELGFKTKKDIENYGLDKFTDTCVDRVKKYAGMITEQSKLLGQWMDWDNSYYTYTDENITSIWHFLKKCDENKWIKKVHRPMPWCPRCGTSLSEHEMSGSYHDVEHDAVFVKLPLLNDDSNILVWTTTPWTLSSNVALAVHPELEYAKIKFTNEDKPIIMCLDVYYKRFKKDGGEILEKFKGTELEGKVYETMFPNFPLQKDLEHKVVLWDMVDAEEGSGIVHIAPGCGAEDFDLGEKLGLAKITPIDESGTFYDNFDFLSNLEAQEVNDLVFDNLKAQNKLFLVHKITHSYPFCWLCKHDILFRLGEEYAIAVDELRPKLIENASSVKWYPEYQGKRMLDWLNNMSDWNISRKRYYGLPLPFYNCECGHLTVVGSKEELKTLAVNPKLVDDIKELHRPWIDEIKITCPECHNEVNRIEQVGDVWLDAGIVPFSTLKYFSDENYFNEYFPAEFIVEAHEQVRLWFYSMLFMSTVIKGVAPYEKVGTHGMVLAEDGSKFSKTGHNISFEDAINTIGVDASRYLYASANPVNNVYFGFSLGEEAKRKLLSYYNMVVFFNTYASLDKIDLKDYKPLQSELTVSDEWLIKTTDEMIKKSTTNMNDYNLRDVCQDFEKFVDDVSNFYIRINRRRFWKSENTLDKKVAYYSLFYALKSITSIMGPMIPFITEYVYQNVIKEYDSSCSESLFMNSYPKVSNYEIDNNILETTFYVREIITSALKLRNENNIKVRQPLSKLYLINKFKLEKYESIILSELNIKEIVYLSDFSTLKNEYLSLNFKEAGSILKGDVNLVKELLNKQENHHQYVDLVKKGHAIILPGYNQELVPAIFNIESKELDNVAIMENDNLKLGLELTIDENLKKEGYLREIIRNCQVFRKEVGFNVEDRINIYFETTDEYVNSILDEYKTMIESELLATITNNNGITKEITEEDYNITVKLEKK